MAHYLALETSAQICSVAVSNNLKVLAENTIDLPNSHSTQIIALVTKTLSQAKVDSQTIDYIVVNDGPGSYTGLRIGCATAKGLCFTSKAQLLAANPFKAIAKENSGNDVIAVIHARKDEAYRVIMNSSNQIIAALEVFKINDILKEIKNYNRPLRVVALQNEILKEGLCNIADIGWHKPLVASNLIKQANQLHSLADYCDLAYYEPNYHRLPLGVS